jgi:hypothetical protein
VEGVFLHHFEYKPTTEKIRSLCQVEVRESHFTFFNIRRFKKVK